MTEKEFAFYQEKALKYVVYSLIYNTNILPDLNEEQREELLNNTFNIMLNSLKPDAAIIWNEMILSLSKSFQSQQNVQDVMDILRRDFDNNK